MFITLREKNTGNQIVVNLMQVCYMREDHIGYDKHTVLHMNSYNVVVEESLYVINEFIDKYNSGT